MNLRLDNNLEYGIVLEGGGAKGAFQIGAWKALQEAGIRIKGVAGTSVGALNGSLICMGELDKAVKLWENITYSSIMEVDDESMTRLFAGKVSYQEVVEGITGFLKDKGIDITPLKNLIIANIEPEKIRNSAMEFYLKTVSVSDFKEVEVDMRKATDEEIISYLMATSYIAPLFKSQKLLGKTFIDGGFADNVPIDVLLNKGYENIISVRIHGIGIEKHIEIPENIRLYQVEPGENLGNIVDFSSENSKKNMVMGYLDTKRMLYGLSGKHYYIDEEEKECYYLKKIIATSDKIKTKLCELCRFSPEENLINRRFLEKILPEQAVKFRLGEDWTYRELYLYILEATATIYHIHKNRIYTVDQLLEAIAAAYKEQGLQEKERIFQYIILDDAI